MARITIPSIFIITAFTAFSHSVKAQMLDAGREHSLFLCDDSIPRSWGKATSGPLGLGVTSNKAIPTTIPNLGQITAVSAGNHFSLFLKQNGTVWATGLNNKGQLGMGNTTTLQEPAQIPSLTNVIAISGGVEFSLFLKSDGTVWGCGLNDAGQFGNGTNSDELTPVQIPGLTNVTAIAAGGTHSLFLLSDGTVKACGLNLEGQLGTGSTSFGSNVPVTVLALSGISKIDAGWSYSLFLKNDGTVWACGSNDSGQLGIGNTTDQSTPVTIPALSGITQISSGPNSLHSLFLKSDGSVWVCGHNGCGQFGMGNTTNSSTPLQNTGLTNVAYIAAGECYSLFVKTDGTGMAAGGNASGGQLGVGNFTNTNTLAAMHNLCPPPVTTGIDENTMDSFSIYPNPSTGSFHVKATTDAQLEITDLSGRIVHSSAISKGETLIDLSGKLTGTYIYRLISSDSSKTGKFILE
jgi:alpha-tubulin suppressor-like RCC1 family protein